MAPHVTSFGYDYDDPPDADHVEDVRNVAYNQQDWKDRAKAIAGRAKGKSRIAIGDKHGHTRSVHIAEHVAKHLNGTVSHRDRKKPRMPLLKGTGKNVRAQNIREMMNAGHSEDQAIAAAYRQQRSSMKKPKTPKKSAMRVKKLKMPKA